MDVIRKPAGSGVDPAAAGAFESRDTTRDSAAAVIAATAPHFRRRHPGIVFTLPSTWAGRSHADSPRGENRSPPRVYLALTRRAARSRDPMGRPATSPETPPSAR